MRQVLQKPGKVSYTIYNVAELSWKIRRETEGLVYG